MKADDLNEAIAELQAEAGRLAEAVTGADGKATPLLVAEALVAADRATRRLVRLRERLQKGGRR